VLTKKINQLSTEVSKKSEELAKLSEKCKALELSYDALLQRCFHERESEREREGERDRERERAHSLPYTSTQAPSSRAVAERDRWAIRNSVLQWSVVRCVAVQCGAGCVAV